MRSFFGGVCFLFLSIFIPSCDQINKSDKYDHLNHRDKIRLRQYLVEGKRLYQLNCANCHQLDGAGLARLYPPLKGSDYLISNKQESICGMRYGQKGEITVNGISFNQEMPPNLTLTNLEIAEIATYVYTVFADTVQIITIHDVQKLLSSCKDQ